MRKTCAGTQNWAPYLSTQAGFVLPQNSDLPLGQVAG